MRVDEGKKGPNFPRDKNEARTVVGTGDSSLPTTPDLSYV